MSENKVKWHPYPKEKPSIEDDYLVTVRGDLNPFIYYLHYTPYRLERGSQWTHVTAWMDKPEPYKEENNGKENT